MSLDESFVDDGPNATSRFNVPKEMQEGELTSFTVVEPRLNGVSECSSTILFTVSRNLRADSRPGTWSMQTRHSHGLKTSPTSKDGECDPSALTFFVTVIRELVGLMILVLASCDHVSMSLRVRHAPQLLQTRSRFVTRPPYSYVSLRGYLDVIPRADGFVLSYESLIELMHMVSCWRRSV